MEPVSGIQQAIEAYAAMLQVGVTLEGDERVLLYGAAKSQLRKSPGDSERMAWEIADFLPLALARSKLAAQGVKFDDYYARIDSRGRLRAYRLLTDEPVYRAAVQLAPELYQSQPAVAEAIARISIEDQLVRTALARGSKAADLEAGPPVLNGPDDLCPPLAEQPRLQPEPWWLTKLRQQQRPWWKFW